MSGLQHHSPSFCFKAIFYTSESLGASKVNFADDSAFWTTNHLMEIIFKPSPAIIDHRGEWANSLLKKLQLTDWSISENKFEIYNKEKSRVYGLAYNKLQCQIKNIMKQVVITEYFLKCLKTTQDLSYFESKQHVSRIGCRYQFLIKTEVTLSDLIDKIRRNYIDLNSNVIERIHSKTSVIDIGFSVNYKDEFGNYNTSIGPMEYAQASKLFDNLKEFEDATLFIDIDYWSKPDKIMHMQEIISIINTFSKEAWQRMTDFKSLIIGK